MLNKIINEFKGNSLRADDLETRIRAELKEDKNDVSQMSPEVRMAYRKMGEDPHENVENHALKAIEARSLAFEDAVSALLDSSLDLNARLQAMRELKVTVLSPEVSRMWAELDIRDFLKIQMSPHRKENASLLLAINCSANAEYKLKLIEKAPFIAVWMTAVAEENDQKIKLKEERKSCISTVGDFVISRNDRSGMIGLSRVGESQVMDFSGIPGIQNFSKENPDVSVRVINELLAREGGYTGTIKHYEHERSDIGAFYVIRHPDMDRVFYRKTIDEAWAAAALSTVRHYERSDLEMFDEPEFEEAECAPSCRP